MIDQAEQAKELSHIYPSWEKIYAVITKVFVWTVLFCVLYLLRSFFLLIFLTFVFAYIQSHGVHLLEKRLENRPLRVTLVGLSFLTIVVSILLFLVPLIGQQATLFANRLPSYLKSLDEEIEVLTNDYPIVQMLVHNSSAESDEDQDAKQQETMTWKSEQSFAVKTLQEMFGLGESSKNSESLGKSIEVVRNVGGQVIATMSAFLLSLLFSFLIVLDFPLLSKKVRHLRFTKLKFVYSEVAEGLRTFAIVLGQSLEAQLIIALCNTMLTALVIHYLGLVDKVAFLSMIVFLCSFIPVAGVFISSVPICILTLLESGFGSVLIAIVMITGVHMVETYILNPKIFGHRLKVNPVLVLIILTVSGKLFHVWGLVLGLPVFTYFFGYAIESESYLRRIHKH